MRVLRGWGRTPEGSGADDAASKRVDAFSRDWQGFAVAEVAAPSHARTPPSFHRLDVKNRTPPERAAACVGSRDGRALTLDAVPLHLAEQRRPRDAQHA